MACASRLSAKAWRLTKRLLELLTSVSDGSRMMRATSLREAAFLLGHSGEKHSWNKSPRAVVLDEKVSSLFTGRDIEQEVNGADAGHGRSSHQVSPPTSSPFHSQNQPPPSVLISKSSVAEWKGNI